MSQINVRRLIGEANACIRCECGVEIAMTPDDGQLGREIEEHALQETDPRKSEAVFNKVHDQLIAQVFAKVP